MPEHGAKGAAFTAGSNESGLSGAVGRRIENSDEGLHWQHFRAPDTADPQALPCSVSIAHGSFDLESANLAAAWDLRLSVDVYGYRKGEELYHTTVKLTDNGPSAVTLDFVGVDKVAFVPSHGAGGATLDAGVGGTILFEDLVFANVKTHAPAEFMPHPFAGDLPHADMHALI